MGSMGTPPIRILLVIFISQNFLKRSSMQVEIQHIRGQKSRRGKRTDKQLVDHPVTLDTHRGGRGGGAMGGHHKTHSGTGWRQGDLRAIVKSTRHPAFCMRAYLIW